MFLFSRFLVVAFTLTLISAGTIAQVPAPVENWFQVIRDSPYWISKGVYQNLKTIRRWVLNGEGYCEVPGRHILFDRRARFIGYFDDGADETETQALLNKQRQKLAAEGRVEKWALGDLQSIGYPFALSCNQPDADLEAALARYTGETAKARLWGTWDGMRIGDKNNMVSLHEAILRVFSDRTAKGYVQLPATTLSTLAGKVLIESGGRADAYSPANARGIMQLSPSALSDCNLPEKFYYHRMAQVDCAMRLLDQNHRNLQQVFEQQFGHLPKEKSEKLYSLLLVQAYHGGVGRMRALMTSADYNGAANYFSEHHSRFSAEDIALGMIFHNLGRYELGLNSLYYVTDVGVATELVCEKYPDLAGCERE